VDPHIGKLFSVEGLSVVVTGGAGGIGSGYAEAMAANGAKLTILDIDQAKLKSQVERLGKYRPVRGDAADVSDPASIRQAMARAADAQGGRLDVVFANVGIEAGSGFLNMSGERVPEFQIENFDDRYWEKVVAVNLGGVWNTIKASVPIMKKQHGGKIIVTTSIASFIVNAMGSAGYYAAKAGAAHLVRRLALELARYNILVNAIAPGGVPTDIGTGHMKTPAVLAATEAAVPLHRMGQPEDFFGVALLLASPSSAYVTGHEFVIDGGLALGMAD
jgi:NAD(P)-dependent dehydrogenase (short-subunit alcohol dehydrogenase family)